MDEKPEFEEVTGDSNPVGDSTTRKVQQLGRVDIPDDYLEQLDVEEGDKVFVACKEDEVRIVKATADRLFDNA